MKSYQDQKKYPSIQRNTSEFNVEHKNSQTPYHIQNQHITV